MTTRIYAGAGHWSTGASNGQGGLFRTEAGSGRWQRRTPAIAAGLANHVWSPNEWLSFPAIQLLRHHPGLAPE